MLFLVAYVLYIHAYAYVSRTRKELECELATPWASDEVPPCLDPITLLVYCSPFPLLSFRVNYIPSQSLSVILFKISFTFLVPLPLALKRPYLILSSIVSSLPIRHKKKQEKHTPTRDWASDKIKNARRLIWMTKACWIRMVKDSEQREGGRSCRGMDRISKERATKTNKETDNLSHIIETQSTKITFVDH